MFLPLLQAEGAQQPSMLGALLPFVLIIVVMYFLMIRPQQKRQKQHTAMLAAIKTGDEVVTAGGMYGNVAGINEQENTVWLKVANEVKVKVDRGSISRVVTVKPN
ncbi:MAG: preprotein translocase subunit YajC [Calditrichaeota bacterium]|nr:preprotein translocase subunit YajC [Calditrichota bacterium]MCB9368025.1 preprotein translocase subunit YajC [Calditrichota bacterium]